MAGKDFCISIHYIWNITGTWKLDKAFNSVNHNILITKLLYCGMNGSASKCLYQLKSSSWGDWRLYSAHAIFILMIHHLISRLSRLILVVDNCTKINAELEVVILRSNKPHLYSHEHAVDSQQATTPFKSASRKFLLTCMSYTLISKAMECIYLPS